MIMMAISIGLIINGSILCFILNDQLSLFFFKLTKRGTGQISQIKKKKLKRERVKRLKVAQTPF